MTPKSHKIAERAAEAEARNRLARAKLEARALRAIASTPARRGRPAKASQTGWGTQAMYRAANRRRINAGPSAPGGSAQYNAPRFQLDRIRADSRDLRQNSWLARAIAKRLCDFVVSDGPIFQVETGDQNLDDAVQNALTDWAEKTDPDRYGKIEITGRYDLARMLRQLVQASLTDGDHFMLYVPGAYADGNTGVTLQMVVADRIASPGGVDIDRSTGYWQGVRITQEGVPTGFRVCEWNISGSSIDFGSGRDIDVDKVLWWRNPMDDVSDAIRGEPGFASIIDRIEFLESYLESVGLAAEIATRFGLVVKSERPASMAAAFESISTEAAQQAGEGFDGKGEVIDLPMASVLHLKPGEDAMQVKPDHPTQNLRDFLMLYIGGISADIGVALSAVLYDAAGLSWSNIKALLAMNWAGINTHQAALKSDVILPYARKKIEEWVRRKIIPQLPPGTRITCSMPSMPVLDFASEVKGYTDAIRANLMTNKEASERLGTGRWDSIALGRKRERETENAYGIDPILPPGSKMMGGEEQSNDAGQ